MEIEEFEKMKEEAEAFLFHTQERAQEMLSEARTNVQSIMANASERFLSEYEYLKEDTECYFKKFRERIEEASATAFSWIQTEKSLEEKKISSEAKTSELSEIKQMLASISERIEKIEGISSKA